MAHPNRRHHVRERRVVGATRRVNLIAVVDLSVYDAFSFLRLGFSNLVFALELWYCIAIIS
ncbi:MAG: hypothetical protein COV70_00835 [Parcubacteria group bacterium CG11_big_fil_rev_8_21_14_0_20_39_22]|nr:MAG: hypothetical protein COV70_00835 [Parcubacteria group bacterium CG11_big_fil_rev_8_21_14_0_20_39_22]